MSKGHERERFWVDDDPRVKPFEQTFAVVDKEVGSAPIAYLSNEDDALLVIEAVKRQEASHE